MGNFVSFSAKSNDCSWYKACDWAHRIIVGKGYTSEVLRSTPQSAVPPVVWALPYKRHDSGQRGVLLVSKSSAMMAVTLEGLGGAATATVLDGTVDGIVLDSEPGFVAPVERAVGDGGALALGPYAVAIVALAD